MSGDGESEVKSASRIQLNPIVLHASARRYVFALPTRERIYVFELRRPRKGGRVRVALYIGRNANDLTLVAESDLDSVVDMLSSQDDDFLKIYADQVAELVDDAVARWDYDARVESIRRLVSKVIVPTRGGVPTGGVETIAVGTIIKLTRDGRLALDQVVVGTKQFLGELPSELLEVVITVASTLKIVNREVGRTSERPPWLVIVAPPSTLKTSVLKLLYDSRYVYWIQNFTAASLLPAKQEVPPLIDAIHNRVFIIPTLSEETADREGARKVFAALESIYDGEYGRSTAISGQSRKPVDTVVVAAVTPAVWERVLPYIENIGSRWLVYRFELDDYEALRIYREELRRLDEVYPHLRRAISQFLDMVMETVTDRDLRSVYIPSEYEKDLDRLALLMAKLRASWGREKWADEDTGKVTEVLRVYHVEAPIRARSQLTLFVRANALLRRDSVEKTVGLPTVDEHAMKLAAKLAISSTSNDMMELVLFLAKNQGRALSVREIERATGISRSQIDRLLKVLSHPKVGVYDPDLHEIRDPYYSVICRYLLEGCWEDEEGGNR